MSKMGIAVISSYRGGYNFEAVGLSRALVNDLFPGMPAKISGEGYASLHLNARAAPRRGVRRRRSRRCRSAASIASAHGGETHAYSAQLMHLLQTAVATDSYSTYLQFSRGVARSAAGLSARPAPVQLPRRRRADRPGRGDHRDPQALRHAGHVARRAVARGARDAGDRDEPDRRARRCRARAARTRCATRPYDNGDNANSVIKQIACGPVRRHRRISQRLRGDRDQGRAGRQARRGRAAARLQGHRVHRQAAPRDAGRDADLAAAAPRHLFDRGSGAAHLRPEADQPARAGVREAGQLGRASAPSRRASPRRMPTSSWSPAMSAAPAPRPQTSIKYAGTPWEMGLSRGQPDADAQRPARPRASCAPTAGSRPGATSSSPRSSAPRNSASARSASSRWAASWCANAIRTPARSASARRTRRCAHKFTGTPEKVINLMTFIAEEVRDILARLGFTQPRRGDRPHRIAPPGQPRRRASRRSRPQPDPRQGRCRRRPSAASASATFRNEVPDSLDAQMIKDAARGVRARREDAADLFGAQHAPRGRHAAVGGDHAHVRHDDAGRRPCPCPAARLGGADRSARSCARASRSKCSATPTIMSARACRAARSSCARWCRSPLASQDNTIIGNTVLYGATCGQAVRGGAGGRALRGAQFGRDRGGRRLRRERLRIYDRRHRGGARARSARISARA